MDFESSLETGKKSEKIFEQWLRKHYKRYADVSSDVEYQKKDIDFITNKESFEVKLNLNDARKGKAGLFFWAELESGNNLGWWYYCKADYFAFFNPENTEFMLLRHDKTFRDFINEKIKTASHDGGGFYRFDYKFDRIYDNFTVRKKLMRVYLSELDKEGVAYTILKTTY
jgi:hypothetical protein